MPSKYKAKPKDRLGSRRGTTAARVNATLKSRKWVEEREILRRVNKDKRAHRQGTLTLQEVRSRLYKGTKQGIYAKEKIFRYRLLK